MRSEVVEIAVPCGGPLYATASIFRVPKRDNNFYNLHAEDDDRIGPPGPGFA